MNLDVYHLNVAKLNGAKKLREIKSLVYSRKFHRSSLTWRTSNLDFDLFNGYQIKWRVWLKREIASLVCSQKNYIEAKRCGYFFISEEVNPLYASCNISIHRRFTCKTCTQCGPVFTFAQVVTCNFLLPCPYQIAVSQL